MIVLQEGADYGLFSIEEIMMGLLSAPHLGKYFPVVDDPYIDYILTKFSKMSLEETGEG
jgi:hypothetical protein